MEKATGAERVLGLRALNRATLARQLLLPGGHRPAGPRSSPEDPDSPTGRDGRARDELILAALEQVGGLQAQAARAGYVGLWARVPDLRRSELTDLLERRLVVKATLMRGTLHLVTGADYLWLRPSVQPLLTRLAHGFVRRSGAVRKSGASRRGGARGRRSQAVTLGELKAEAEGFFSEPRSLDDLRALLQERYEGPNLDRLASALRVELALLHAPQKTAAWGFPAQPRLVDAESWLGRPISEQGDPRALIRRYLAAFGPATVADARAWSGLSVLSREFEALRPELEVFAGPEGPELFDVPGARRPRPAETLPPIFVPEWDSVLLGHDDRRRIVPDEFREPVYQRLRQLIGPAALLDGFAAALWRIEREGSAERRKATLAIAPFRELTSKEREALARPGERLARFMVPDATSAGVRFTSL